MKVSDSIEQYGPATDLKVADLVKDNNPRIYLLNSSGSGKSYLRTSKQGIRTKEVNSLKYQRAINIWSFRASSKSN